VQYLNSYATNYDVLLEKIDTIDDTKNKMSIEEHLYNIAEALEEDENVFRNDLNWLQFHFDKTHLITFRDDLDTNNIHLHCKVPVSDLTPEDKKTLLNANLLGHATNHTRMGLNMSEDHLVCFSSLDSDADEERVEECIVDMINNVNYWHKKYNH
jgi:hypothetical protein